MVDGELKKCDSPNTVLKLPGNKTKKKMEMLIMCLSNSRAEILSKPAMDVLQSIGHVVIDSLRVKKILSKLTMVVDFQSIVEEITDCSFLYWRREMMRDWLSMVYIDDKFSWLHCLIWVMLLNLPNIHMRENCKEQVDSYENSIVD